jgi:hypothetical protein
VNRRLEAARLDLRGPLRSPAMGDGVSASVSACVCVCGRVCVRERERGKSTARSGDPEWAMESGRRSVFAGRVDSHCIERERQCTRHGRWSQSVGQRMCSLCSFFARSSVPPVSVSVSACR